MSEAKMAVQLNPTKRSYSIKQRWNTVRYRVQESYHRMQGRQIVHFLHIGKTGGTAIRYALAGFPVTAGYLIRRHGHRTPLSQIPDGEKVFFFLRDPQTRFISGFNSRLRQGRPRYNLPWSAGEEIAFQRFSTPNQLALGLSAEDESVRRQAEQAMQTIGQIKYTYLRWFGSEEYFRSRLSDMFFIGFQEDLASDFQLLKLKLGVPGTAKLPDDDVLAHRSPRDLDRTLDEKAARNLRRWYAADLSFFELCKAHAKQINGR